MYPQQNSPAPNNPYDFIVNPQQPQKRNPFGGGSAVMKIGLILGLLLLLLIAFTVIRSVLSSGSSNATAIVAVISQQQELIRITKAADDSKQPLRDTTRNSVITTNASVTSSKRELTAYAALQGQKIKVKQLLSPSRKATDVQLAAALSAGTYDATLVSVMETQLTDYQQDLRRAYNKTTGTKGRELLDKQYKGSVLLLQQIKAAQ